jgi:hypothetical protein
MNRRRKFRQSVLIGRRKRPAILETIAKNDCTIFAVIQKNKVIATRSTSKTQDEEAALMRLSKAVAGMSYVFVIPVPQQKDGVKKRYFKVNN